MPGPAQASAGDGAGLSLGADTGAETPTVTGESGQSGEETRRLERILSTVTFVARTAENTAECDSDQQRITSYPVRNLESRGLFTGGQPGCDNGKQSQHREPTLVRPAPDL